MGERRNGGSEDRGAALETPSRVQRRSTPGGAKPHITGRWALNLDVGPEGDWHPHIWANATVREAMAHGSEMSAGGDALWGGADLLDARAALGRIDHPGGGEPEPVWCATHPRAVAEWVVSMAKVAAEVRAPDRFNAKRWLDRRGRARCAELLRRAEEALPEAGAAIRAWRKQLERGPEIPVLSDQDLMRIGMVREEWPGGTRMPRPRHPAETRARSGGHQ